MEEKVNFIKEIAADYWFPEKSRLLVQADVIERATGDKETAVDKSCQFTSSPYVVEIKDTLDYFKPGLPFAVKVKNKKKLCFEHKNSGICIININRHKSL